MELPVRSYPKLPESPRPPPDESPSRPNEIGGPESSGKYLGVREFPGEGTFHVYESGYRMPTHIDGETVNPAWGLTKANKPRKRLALACLDCREKKIKCEPAPNGCIQCVKAKRPCRRTATHPQPHELGATPSSTAWTGMDTDESEGKRRSDSKKIAASTPTTTASDDDPERDMMLQLVETFLVRVNSAVYRLFPPAAFTRWARAAEERNGDEMIVLDAIIGLGSVFAGDRYATFGHRCAENAHAAIAALMGRQSLCIAQAQLLLRLYYMAIGRHELAWDYAGAASRTSTGVALQLHREGAGSTGDGRRPFGLTIDQLAECRRRTFWACFLMDRLEGEVTNWVAPADVCLRLPCADAAYDRGLRSDSPYFDTEGAARAPLGLAGELAWLETVAARWGEVRLHLRTATHQARATYRAMHEAFYVHMQAALAGWVASLPQVLRDTDENLRTSIAEGYSGPFVLMHALHAFTLLRLNRHVRHALVPERVERQVRAAHDAALSLLSLAGRALRAGDTAPERRAAIEDGLSCLRGLERYWDQARTQRRVSEKRYEQVLSGTWTKEALEDEFGPECDCIYGLPRA
ncbi:hypothetical protein K470DRAFT_300778 [Piedraia hortae CBS 480.64]|uniref:Zn(2)-C6 fungal-type domain-containing protein n=1 Tax=Piedraia hortae CBS 480.64 TaxID=1314780 RepID=A0A6A7BTN5_9PEZI|nr:hypothetical protein K470DRAFT_300778 [Piedraia hortae CBS 480.64]